MTVSCRSQVFALQASLTLTLLHCSLYIGTETSRPILKTRSQQHQFLENNRIDCWSSCISDYDANNVVYPLLGHTPYSATAPPRDAPYNKTPKCHPTTKAIRKLGFFKPLKLSIVIYFEVYAPQPAPTIFLAQP